MVKRRRAGYNGLFFFVEYCHILVYDKRKGLEGETMKLRNVYILCRDYDYVVGGVEFEQEVINGIRRYNVSYWSDCYNILVKLYSIECFKEITDEIFSLVSPITMKDDNFIIDCENGEKLKIKLFELSEKMSTIVDFYGMVFDEQKEFGFDVKLASYSDLDEFVDQINELKFIIQQCPFFRSRDGIIKFGNVDVGSTWLTFFVCGSAAIALLKGLAALIDQATIIKSHINTNKQQQEMLRTMEIKNDLAEQMEEVFKQFKDAQLSDCVKNIEKELDVKLKDGEEIDKARRSVEKMSELLDRGVQIYTSLDAPLEVQAVFPAMETPSLLTDGLKLLSDNED